MFGRYTLVALFITILILLGIPVSAADSYSYSIMHLSDTQYLSESDPQTLDYTFSYLESLKNAFNISAIIITGDLVNNGDDLSQWIHYTEARSRTTIPVYEIPGDEDLGNKADNPLVNEFVGNKTNWNAIINDFIFIGIGYTEDSLSDAEIAHYKAIIEGNPQKFTLIAVHNYYNKDLTISLLGESIRENLILKPTFILSGHAHATTLNSGFINNILYVEDLTNYQSFGNFSAGNLYTVYITDGNVTKITVREAYIFPYHYFYPEKIVYQMPIDGQPNSPTVSPTKSWIYPDASPTVYPTKSWIYPDASPTVYPTKSWIYPDASPAAYPTKSWIYPNASPTAYPTKSWIYPNASPTVYPSKSSIYLNVPPTAYPTKSWIYPNASPTVYPSKSWIYPNTSPTAYPTKSWIYPDTSP